jgi:DNA-binding MarR family transcriptional regulator
MAQRAGPGIPLAGGPASGVRGDGVPPGKGTVVPPGDTDDSDAELFEVPELRDEVDDLVAAWRAQRPDLDVEPMQVLSRISRLARHLDIARRGAFADHGLETWEFDVLSALRRQGPPFQLTPGALLRATLVTSGTMTNRIDRLAEAGLVRREPDPSDKRGVLVTLTDQGVARADAALADLLGRERVLLAGLDPGERQHLADLIRILLAPFDNDLAGLSPSRLPPGALDAPPSLFAPSSLVSPGGRRALWLARGAFPRRSFVARQSRRRRALWLAGPLARGGPIRAQQPQPASGLPGRISRLGRRGGRRRGR